MSNTEKEIDPRSKYKRWLINIIIIVVATVVMLALAETALRWIDGYRFSTLELNQNNTEIQSSE